MDKPLLIVGGSVLIAGGLAYWYLSQQNGNGPPPPPECRNGDTKCIGENLYTCINGKWQLTEKNSPQCIEACWGENECGIPFFTRCDENNNLCRCQDGKWKAAEYNSWKCRSGETHKECFVDPETNISWCLPVPGEGKDYCWASEPLYGSEGCSCNPPKQCATGIGYPYWCDTDVQMCIADRGGTHLFEGSQLPGDTHLGQCLTEDISVYGDWAVPTHRMVSATINWKNAFPGDMFDVGIYIVSLSGMAQHIWKGEIAWWGGSGVTKFDIPMLFPKQSVYMVQVYVAENGRDPELDYFVVEVS